MRKVLYEKETGDCCQDTIALLRTTRKKSAPHGRAVTHPVLAINVQQDIFQDMLNENFMDAFQNYDYDSRVALNDGLEKQEVNNCKVR